MYTRVLEFAGAKDIDGGVEYLRQKVAPILDAQKGHRGITASADRSGALLGILSLWETEADRDASDSALATSRQEALEIVGGELTVEKYEQLVAEVSSPPGPGSALMVNRISMDPAKIDENFAFFRSDVLPRIKSNAGFQSIRHMINRETGHGLVGTVWVDQDAMKAAASEAQSRRPEAIARGIGFDSVSSREILYSLLR